MKILVLSNVMGSVDRVVDIIQQSNNVIAKEVGMSNGALAAAAQEALEARTYNLVVVVAKDPIGAGMLLNKQAAIEAAVCDSAEDAALAKENGANAIIIRNVGSDALGEILTEVSGGAGVPQKLREGIKLPSFVRQRKAEQPAEPQKDKKRPQAKQEDGGEAASEDESKLESLSASRKDLIGKLKNALGIL